MKITDIRLVLAARSEMPVCAYCSVTFDNCLVIHDLRVLRRGERLFVAMPNRKRMIPCPACRFKNAVQARHCNDCGMALSPPNPTASEADVRRYVDIAHPVSPEFRQLLEQQIIARYQDLASHDKQGRPSATPLAAIDRDAWSTPTQIHDGR